jgi:hypothetical protein
METASKIFFGIVIIIIIAVLHHSTDTLKSDSDVYFKNLGLILTGIVTDKQVVSGSRGMLYMDVRSTTIPDYDIRLSDKYYYCVIHHNKAEIVEGGLTEIQIGDSIVINSNTRSIIDYRNGNIVVKRPIYLTEFQPVWSWIKRLHQLDYDK